VYQREGGAGVGATVTRLVCTVDTLDTLVWCATMSVCVGTGTSNPLASIPAINVMILSLVIVMEYQFCRAVYILQLLGGAFGRWVQPCMQGWGLFWWIEVVALILRRVPPLLWPILVCYGVDCGSFGWSSTSDLRPWGVVRYGIGTAQSWPYGRSLRRF